MRNQRNAYYDALAAQARAERNKDIKTDEMVPQHAYVWWQTQMSTLARRCMYCTFLLAEMMGWVVRTWCVFPGRVVLLCVAAVLIGLRCTGGCRSLASEVDSGAKPNADQRAALMQQAMGAPKVWIRAL